MKSQKFHVLYKLKVIILHFKTRHEVSRLTWIKDHKFSFTKVELHFIGFVIRYCVFKLLKYSTSRFWKLMTGSLMICYWFWSKAAFRDKDFVSIVSAIVKSSTNFKCISFATFILFLLVAMSPALLDCP